MPDPQKSRILCGKIYDSQLFRFQSCGLSNLTTWSIIHVFQTFFFLQQPWLVVCGVFLRGPELGMEEELRKMSGGLFEGYFTSYNMAYVRTTTVHTLELHFKLAKKSVFCKGFCTIPYPSMSPLCKYPNRNAHKKKIYATKAL